MTTQSVVKMATQRRTWGSKWCHIGTQRSRWGRNIFANRLVSILAGTQRVVSLREEEDEGEKEEEEGEGKEEEEGPLCVLQDDPK